MKLMDRADQLILGDRNKEDLEEAHAMYLKAGQIFEQVNAGHRILGPLQIKGSHFDETRLQVGRAIRSVQGAEKLIIALKTMKKEEAN